MSSPHSSASFCAWCQRWFANGQYLTPPAAEPAIAQSQTKPSREKSDLAGDQATSLTSVPSAPDLISHGVCSPCMAGALAEGLANVKAITETI